MNPVYSIMESPHRWEILGGLAFGTGFVGAIAMLSWGWPQWFIRVWFLAGLVVALYCVVMLILQWKAQVEELPMTPTARESSDD